MDYHPGYLEREYRKLCNRIVKTNLNYHSENLRRLEEIIVREADPKKYRQEALHCLGELLMQPADIHYGKAEI